MPRPWIRLAALSDQQAEELLALNMALNRLEEMISRQRQVVEFGLFKSERH